LAPGPPAENHDFIPPPQFADLNGDGGLDTLVHVPPIPGAGVGEFTLRAISLRDGKELWSKPLRHQVNFIGTLDLGDLDGDGRPEVVLMEELLKQNNIELEVQAFRGSDCAMLWQWRGGAQFPGERPNPSMDIANLNGNGKYQVCVSYRDKSGARRIVVLDES